MPSLRGVDKLKVWKTNCKFLWPWRQQGLAWIAGCGVPGAARNCPFLNGPNIAMTEKSIISGIAGNAIIVFKPLQASPRLTTSRHGTMFSPRC